MPADSWETAPIPHVDDEYQGRRRRLRTGSRLSGAGWAVVSGVVLLLCAAVALPFLISSNSADQSGGAGTTTQVGDTPTGTDVSPGSGLPVIGISGVPETPSPTAPTSTAPGGPPTTSSAPFQTLTLEAWNYGIPYQNKSYCNNVKGVRLGANGSASSVNFGNFTVPNQGTYTVTIYAGQQSEDGSVPIALTIDGIDLPTPPVSACGPLPPVSLQLSAGSHSAVVTFKGRANQGQSVLIEQIVIGSP
jgi:hypothetical protein